MREKVSSRAHLPHSSPHIFPPLSLPSSPPLQLLHSPALPQVDRLRLLLTASDILQGQGEALTIDRREFYIRLYEAVGLVPYRQVRDTPLLGKDPPLREGGREREGEKERARPARTTRTRTHFLHSHPLHSNPLLTLSLTSGGGQDDEDEDDEMQDVLGGSGAGGGGGGDAAFAGQESLPVLLASTMQQVGVTSHTHTHTCTHSSSSHAPSASPFYP